MSVERREDERDDPQARVEAERQRLIEGKMTAAEAQAFLSALEKESIEIADAEVEIRVAAAEAEVERLRGQVLRMESTGAVEAVAAPLRAARDSAEAKAAEATKYAERLYGELARLLQPHKAPVESLVHPVPIVERLLAERDRLAALLGRVISQAPCIKIELDADIREALSVLDRETQREAP